MSGQCSILKSGFSIYKWRFLVVSSIALLSSPLVDYPVVDYRSGVGSGICFSKDAANFLFS